jgi:hypothetical protein
MFGSLSVSEEELGMAAGETVTLTVGVRLEGCEEYNLYWKLYGDEILDVQWGEKNEDGSRTLTVAAKGSGEADLELWLEENGTALILDYLSIPVSVE